MAKTVRSSPPKPQPSRPIKKFTPPAPAAKPSNGKPGNDGKIDPRQMRF